MTSTEQARSAPAPDESATRKAVAAAAIGNATEWFDFAAYSYVATIIGGQFFPVTDQSAKTLSAFAVFAASFVIRPLGSLFFGPLGDKIGRKRVLAATILLMSGATFLVGLLPSYAQIGIWAPILLVAIRMVQGFSTGGEYAGAATYISESSPDRRRGFLGSWLEFGTLSGFTAGAILATVLTIELPTEAMNSWGWRVPFLVALPLGVIGLYLRLRLDESPAFKELEQRAATDTAPRAPLREALTKHWRDMLICVGIVILINVADYTVLTYMPSYLTGVLHISDQTSLWMSVVVMLAMMAIILPLGALSDRIGRKPLMLVSAIGYLLFSYPAFLLLSMGSPLSTLFGLAIIGFFLVCILAVIGSTLPAIFDTRVRYAGFAVSYNISTSLFGGTAPVIITILLRQTGNDFIPAYYLMAAAAIAIVPIMLMKETARTPLRGTEAARRLSDDLTPHTSSVSDPDPA
ncbi:MAG TPA: MFS transporter [Pseudonocardiaceae bacterium]|jgi:MHS family proline/betaine transporter-like MFS transporter